MILSGIMLHARHALAVFWLSLAFMPKHKVMAVMDLGHLVQSLQSICTHKRALSAFAT